MRSRKSRRAALIEAIEPRRLLSTIYVDANATGATHNGASWNSAYQDLQLALSAAVSGDEIRVADGTYKPTSGTDRTITFLLRPGVSLFGSFAGYGAANPNARDMTAHKTTLSGDIGTVGLQTDNSYHVVIANGGAASALIDGVLVTLGNANGTGRDQDSGAGLLATGIDLLRLNNCTFEANAAAYGGGATIGAVVAENCEFIGNTATASGGGIYNSASGVLTNCRFIGNTARTGGAMSNYIESPTLLGCIFSKNMAINAGGAMYNSGADANLIGCTFEGNIAVKSGGGMFNIANAFATLTNCIFSGNSAPLGGGIRNSNYSDPTLTNCIFSGNVATTSGGAIYNDNSSPKLNNCIVWGNGTDPIRSISFSTPIVAHSDIQGGYSGTGNLNADPLFIRNPSPGSDGGWGTADDDFGDLRLKITSPCIDAGSNADVPANATTDIAGDPRIVDMPGVRDPGAIVDLGAFERIAPYADAAFLPDGVAQRISVQFSVDLLLTSLSASDLILTNQTTGQVIDCAAAAVCSYNANSRTANWTFQSPLTDGNYLAILSSSGVSDASGQPAISTDLVFNFFTLGGDANRDRLVDIKDLYILSSNWSGDNKLFSQGDFNYDGKVDADDLAILSAHWQQNLAPPVAAAPVSLAKVAKRTPVRLVSVVG